MIKNSRRPKQCCRTDREGSEIKKDHKQHGFTTKQKKRNVYFEKSEEEDKIFEVVWAFIFT